LPAPPLPEGETEAAELAKYKLSENAMELMDDLLQWLIWGGVPADSLILDYRKEIESTFG